MTAEQKEDRRAAVARACLSAVALNVHGSNSRSRGAERGTERSGRRDPRPAVCERRAAHSGQGLAQGHATHTPQEAGEADSRGKRPLDTKRSWCDG